MEQAAFAFLTNGKPVQAEVFGHGHINHTLKVVTDTGDIYILQKINKYVFKDPVKLMENAAAVTEFLRKKVERPENALEFIPTADGSFCYEDPQGEFWRMYRFVGGFCLEAPESPEDFYQSAIAFGQFQYQLADFPAETLTETIPEFHNTPDRYRQLREAAAQDAKGRLAGVGEELKFLLDREEEMGTLQRMRERGELPLRVTHNDTKINNVLFDEKTRKALVVIDLDTVMPGLVGHDFGDAIRFAANQVEEDCPQAERAGVNLNIYWAFAEGFIQRTAAALTQAEADTLGLSCFALACELATRFLDDYLLGDKYFKIKDSLHNLTRTRCQIALAQDMQRKMAAMNAIARDCWERYKTAE